MRSRIVVAAIVCIAAGCGSPRANSPFEPRATPVPGGCGATPLFHGRLPPWTAPAFTDSPGPPPGPDALSEHGTVAAVVFGYPMRAGNPRGRTNKVLWIMKLPRLGSSLRIQAKPLHAATPLLRFTFPADSSPGEIYPSHVNVPTAGCWRLTLRWAGHEDSMDLNYNA